MVELGALVLTEVERMGESSNSRRENIWSGSPMRGSNKVFFVTFAVQMYVAGNHLLFTRSVEYAEKMKTTTRKI